MTQGAAAYTRLQRPGNSISQGLQYWGGIQAKENAEKRARDERDQVRKNKAIKELDAKWGSGMMEKLKATVSNFDTADKINADYSMKMRKKFTENYNEMRKAKQAGDLDKVSELQLNSQNMLNSFEQVQTFYKGLQEKYKDYQKLVSEGKISDVESENFEAEMESLIKNYDGAFELDERYSPSILGIKPNGEPFEVSYTDFVNGNWSPYLKQDPNGIVKDTLGLLGKRKKDRVTGDYIRTDQKWDETRAEAASGYVDAIVSNDAKMADLYNQMIDPSSKQKKGFSDSQKKQVKDLLIQRIKAGYDENMSIKGNPARNDRKKTKPKTPEQEKASRLHYDVKRAVNDGDYTVLMTNVQDEYNEDKFNTVADVVKKGNQLLLRDESGRNIGSVNNTTRAITDFLINNARSYRDMDADTVLSEEPVEYRKGNTAAIDILDVADRLFDSSGKPKEDDEEIMKILQDTGLNDMKDVFTWDGNSLEYKGVEISTASKSQFKRDLAKALELKQPKSIKTQSGNTYKIK